MPSENNSKAVKVVKMSEGEINSGLDFGKTILFQLLKPQAKYFLNSLDNKDQQLKCFDDKKETLLPLNEGEIEKIAFNLVKAGYTDKNLWELSSDEILKVIRQKKSMITAYIDTNKFSKRISLNTKKESTFKKWSAQNVWKLALTDKGIMKNLVDASNYKETTD